MDTSVLAFWQCHSINRIRSYSYLNMRFGRQNVDDSFDNIIDI